MTTESTSSYKYILTNEILIIMWSTFLFKWWLHGWVDSKYIIIILPSTHGTTFSLIYLFMNLTHTASDTSVLRFLLSTAFDIMAPRNLMSVLHKSDVTAGMWNWSADLVSWLWYSLFLWNKDAKYSVSICSQSALQMLMPWCQSTRPSAPTKQTWQTEHKDMVRAWLTIIDSIKTIQMLLRVYFSTSQHRGRWCSGGYEGDSVWRINPIMQKWYTYWFQIYKPISKWAPLKYYRWNNLVQASNEL